MDPLSVTASVVGLLSVSVKVSIVLSEVIRKSRHAPEECRKVRDEVDGIHRVLGQLQLFIAGSSRASQQRTSLIMVDQVVATLGACVTTFSELEVFAEGLASDQGMGLLDRLRWMAKEKDAKTILGELEARKSSMTLMLSILTCQKQDEAEDKVDQLSAIVQKILDQSTTIAERMAAFEAPGATTLAVQKGERAPVSITTPSDKDGAGPAGQNSTETVADQAAGQHSSADSELPPAAAASFVRNTRGFAFEELLMDSRAYRNAAHDGSDAFSAATSAGRTATWSMLSGLSLSEMSNVGILAVPVYASDIANEEAYDFSAPPPPPPQQQQQEPASKKTDAATAAGDAFDAVADRTLTSAADEARSPRSRWSQGFKDFRDKLTKPEPGGRTAEKSISKAQTKHIFGVPVTESVRYAHVPLVLSDESGGYFVYGHVPIIVAKACSFLKEEGTKVENIFAHPGNSSRVMHLQRAFDTPRRYGKGLKWTGYTVHDAASLLLRYLKTLPEPLVPYQFYELFTTGFHQEGGERVVQGDYEQDPSEGYAARVQAATKQQAARIAKLRRNVLALSPLSRTMLLYLLDLLAVFASLAEDNRMTATRLVGLFQPSLLALPPASMSSEEHELALNVMVFMVDHQNEFLMESLKSR